MKINNDMLEININNIKIDLKINDARELRDKLALKIREYDSKEKQEFNHTIIEDKPEIIVNPEKTNNQEINNDFELFKKETKPELYY